ncbi:hypothetical protein [Massilia sp. YIM B04103]|uniref:hypothetical protein n=1 Tax=Massilia sp. YIM B04103 TaxID=2963106 RepID=UPI00210B5167|nr:hypothetical protein [Massilia sp. YIM B04103]
MSQNLFTPWLACCSSAAAMLNEARQQLPAGQAQCAQFLKTLLDADKQRQQLQAEALTSLLHLQAGLLQPLMSGFGPRQWAEFQAGWSAQQEESWQAFSERGKMYCADLRKTQTQDEATMVLGGALTDMGARLKEDAEQAFTLLNSASAAAGILSGKVLDELIGAAAPAAASAPRGE